MKYTKEILEEAVVNSVSIAGVLRYLNLKPAGGTHSHISRRIKEFEISTEHFLGKRANSGDSHRGGPEKRSAKQLLVNNRTGRREKALYLRRALIEVGVPYKCSECGQGKTWKGKPLALQVDHINKDWLDNRKSNLRFLCPNCHSQSDGWCGRKNTPG